MMLGPEPTSQRKSPARTQLTALCALGVALVSACGGGSDGAVPPAGPAVTPPPASAPPVPPDPVATPSPPSPPAAVPQPDASVLRLYESAAVHASLAASPIFYATFWEDEYYRVWDNGGSLRALLDGSPPAPDTVLPTGRHTFAVTFDHCLVDLLIGTSLDGTASAAYARNSLDDLTALVSVNSMRGILANFRSDLRDVTANGSGTWTRVLTGRGMASITTYTPTIGSILVNNATSNVATFMGGSYSSSYDYGSPPPGSSGWGEEEFNDLTIAVSGTSYALNGSLQWVYGSECCVELSRTGEVRITSNGNLMARIYGDGSGTLRTEVLSPLLPL